MTSGGDVSAQSIRRMTLPPIYGLESHEKLSGGGEEERNPRRFSARASIVGQGRTKKALRVRH